MEVRYIPTDLTHELFDSTNLADSAALLAENLLRVRCADDDVGHCWCDTDFDARVALFSQLALEELIELSVEDTVSNELASLRDVDTARSGSWSLHFGCLQFGMSLRSCEGLSATAARIFLLKMDRHVHRLDSRSCAEYCSLTAPALLDMAALTIGAEAMDPLICDGSTYRLTVVLMAEEVGWSFASFLWWAVPRLRIRSAGRCYA